MIEIICRENQQEEQEIKPPKNIRQVGSPRGRHKIYVEDYVYTYLRNQARTVQKSAAVLLGKSYVSKDMRYTFISGAIECGRAVFQFDSIYLDESFWEYIYEEGKEYFSDTTIVGWFVGKKGEGMQLTTAIESAHRKYFTGRDKVLMLMDAEEDEELFYIYEQGYLQKREGYYIYYEKNISMQEYMIKKREEKSAEETEWESLHKEMREEIVEEEKEERKEAAREKIFVKSSMEEPLSEGERALQNYRQLMQEKRGHKVERQNKRFLYAAASFFLMVFCVVGITTINNYRKMKEVEDVLHIIKEETKEETSDLIVESVESDVVPLEEEQQQTEQQVLEIQNVETKTQEQQAIQQQTPEPQYYVVQAGDTLESICLKIYQDKSKIAELCQVNGIANGNQIQAGQKLILP